MLSRIKKILSLDKKQDPYEDQWEIKKIGNLKMPESLTDNNAFLLANSVAELYFPIDFYADRISKLRYFIEDKNGKEIEATELNRFITNINPLYSFSDLIYQYVFSLLSDGNANNYLGVPSSYKNISVNNIARWDVLQPNLLSIWEYNNISMLELSNFQDAIQKAEYYEGTKNKLLDVSKLFIDNYNVNKRSTSFVLSKSPLFSSNKSIDTLLAVYSARYNVYANNGTAGYLSRKTTAGQSNMALESMMTDSSKRDEIVADLKNRNGLVGNKNLWGISGIPIEFVKTIASIQELMPLDETLEAAIKIASTYQIPPELVPRKDQSTFSNKDTSEKTVWENGILSLSRTVNENLTKLFKINKAGYKINADYSSVTALQLNKGTIEDLKTKQLDNLKKLKELNPALKIESETKKILDSYGH